MDIAPQFLLIGAVAAIGVLHTMVPDHWVPITVIARQQGWSRRETARSAFIAGAGHVLSTLLIALAVWVAGAAFAQRFGAMVDTAASVALIAFGVWIALSAWPERHGHSHPHGQGGHHHHQHGDDASAVLFRHTHPHRHGAGPAHVHWHQHSPGTAHAIALGDPPLHEHAHAAIGRAGLLLILGSSPMVEGIPAFFAAGRYGPGLIAAMASVFAVSTIATYVVLCVASVAGLQRVGIGPLERYGEVLSGAVIAALGLVFWLL